LGFCPAAGSGGKERGHSCPLRGKKRGQESPRAVVPFRSVHSRRESLFSLGERIKKEIEFAENIGEKVNEELYKLREKSMKNLTD